MIIANLIPLTLVAASVVVYFVSQEPASAEPHLENLEWTHFFSSSPYVCVTGTISNPSHASIRNVTLWVDIYVDYACGHHMNALLKTERLDMGTVEATKTMDFTRDVPYLKNDEYFFRYIQYHLDWN